MSSMVLEKLFGSTSRIKIIRLFLLNPENLFTTNEISRRCKVQISTVRREISVLKSIGFIKEKTETIETILKLKNGKVKNKTKKQKITGLILNDFFPLLIPLKNLILNATPVDKEKMIKKIVSAGKIKLIILAGIFIQSDESRVDMLIIGDAINKSKLENALRGIESELGRELQYAIFNTKEFLYRMDMYDKFLRDILDYQHEKVINKLNI